MCHTSIRRSLLSTIKMAGYYLILMFHDSLTPLHSVHRRCREWFYWYSVFIDGIKQLYRLFNRLVTDYATSGKFAPKNQERLCRKHGKASLTGTRRETVYAILIVRAPTVVSRTIVASKPRWVQSDIRERVTDFGNVSTLPTPPSFCAPSPTFPYRPESS